MMTITLVLVAVAVTFVQLGSMESGRLSAIVDAVGVSLLLGTVGMLIVQSLWFLLLAPSSVGLVLVVLNRYYGIASRAEVSFVNETQWLSVIFSLSLVASWWLHTFGVTFSRVATVSASVVLLLSVFVHLLLLLHIHRYRLNPAKKLALDKLESLPTVSVLVPARNESHALNDSITKLLSSSYPKLEVLILDDCSHDKTPEIIRGFAHDGARFIEGTPPTDEWLGRNWALQQLSEAANGDVLVFADVDVKFSENTVADIVGVMQRDQLDMVSFVPRSTPSGLLGSLLPSLTNFWLTLIPFRVMHGRAAIGRCFAVTKQTISGRPLSQFKTSIYPVYALAKSLLPEGMRYKFFFGKNIDMSIQHHYHSTSRSLLRTLSPAISNRFDLGITLVLVALVMLIVSFGAVLSGQLLLGFVLLASISLLFCSVAFATTGITAVVVALLWPLHVIHEAAHLVVSLIRYRFTDLRWKQRKVCLSVLQTHDRLPEA